MLIDTQKHGFTVIRSRALPELDAQMHYLRHERTGLELVWLERDEVNMTFGIAFPTLPEDDTGVFHSHEHSVLCGSERDPAKEPFVERHDLPGQDLLSHFQPQPEGPHKPDARLPGRRFPPHDL